MPSKFCTQCGAKIETGQRFCPECGTAVETPVETTPPAQTRTNPAAASRRNRTLMALLLGIGALAVVLVVVVIYWATARPPAIVGNFPPVHTADGYPFPDVPRISVQEAKARLDAGSAIFVDVRSRGQFNLSRIPGAVSIPIDEFEARYGEVPRNVEVITYCT
ncbi:MAG: zinc-ribbon domain-containing protein [Caldilineaceae bacterium]|nr:zinc-ribbon domain-containing protein [Caldilineaceae bacterium]